MLTSTHTETRTGTSVRERMRGLERMRTLKRVRTSQLGIRRQAWGPASGHIITKVGVRCHDKDQLRSTPRRAHFRFYTDGPREVFVATSSPY